MAGTDLSLAGGEGAFDGYLAVPSSGTAPGVVLVCTIFGVDADLRNVCDNLAAHGFLALAPDLFWRGDKGPMPRTEEGVKRASARAEDRVGLAATGKIGRAHV